MLLSSLWGQMGASHARPLRGRTVFLVGVCGALPHTTDTNTMDL
ncbi:hypothetical protein KDH_64090 [Dictyobacter sp. S3.2.2.5]|uniref:Uncharacterized protein n=1 Tax=Dictyobacter halimunensis TaxID=3026934 RepID=A0ABQ6G0N0_9CHLR|nr:hypothetical protein KDH_64090 [Dictyobacter sp. S3.2.2.5]